MPGIENFAPERTETKSGLSGLPNSFPRSFSRAEMAASSSCESSEGNLLPLRYSRQASVVMVKPGGTGSPSLTISARFAPFPPRRSDCVRSPTENGNMKDLAMPNSTFSTLVVNYKASPGKGARVREVRGEREELLLPIWREERR